VSSKRFEALFAPAIRVRRGLVAFSASATFIGVVLIGQMPLRPALKMSFALLWVTRGLLEMVSQLRGIARTGRLRINAHGSLEAQSPEGKTRPVELLGGSLVLSRVAWLRFRFEDGLRYGELLSASGRQDDNWRRLRLIWRQRASSLSDLGDRSSRSVPGPTGC
jgi:hypothetical protein